MQGSFNKTRIAPTPSGYLHLGNVYSFALTTALARRTGAKILLRIDDLDRDRVEPKYVQDIFDTLEFMEITWDEGPRNAREFEERYSQVHRMDLYREALQQLRDSGSVFACTCSRSQIGSVYPGTCKDKGLSPDTPDAAWRLDTSLARTPVDPDLPPAMQYFVVRKKDGFPAYQLSSVLDDLYYGVDLVVRGEDLRPSTMAQQYLARVLQKNSFRDIAFYHHPLLYGPDWEKLSKSAGATSVQYLRKQGKTRQEVYTLLARMLGFASSAPGTWEELVSLSSFPA